MKLRSLFRWSLLGLGAILAIAGITWWGARRHRRLEACLANLFQVAHPQYKGATGLLNPNGSRQRPGRRFYTSAG
jgi:hypothetical protein